MFTVIMGTTEAPQQQRLPVGSKELPMRIMVIAGTSRDYVGLWRDVATFVVPDAGVQFPRLVEAVPLESMAAVMARISRRLDELKTSCAAIPPSSSDQSRRIAGQDALLLHEALREAVRHLPDSHDQRFRKWLAESDDAAKGIYDSLRSGSADGAVRHLNALQQLCTQCHTAYRN